MFILSINNAPLSLSSMTPWLLHICSPTTFWYQQHCPTTHPRPATAIFSTAAAATTTAANVADAAAATARRCCRCHRCQRCCCNCRVWATIPMSSNPLKKPPPHILAAGNAILRDLDLSQKALDALFDKNRALNFDEDVTAIILQAMPTPQPASSRRLHFTPPPARRASLPRPLTINKSPQAPSRQITPVPVQITTL